MPFVMKGDAQAGSPPSGTQAATLVGVGNQQKRDTFVEERSGGNGGVVGLPEQAVVAFALG
jgi:hypothetical protein